MAMPMMAGVGFQAQIASIIELLANSAVQEICKLVDDGYTAMRSQMELEREQSEKEKEFLRRRLRDMDVRVRNYERKIKTLSTPPVPAVVEVQIPPPRAATDYTAIQQVDTSQAAQSLSQVKQELADSELSMKEESGSPGISPTLQIVLNDEVASSLWQQEFDSRGDDSTSSAMPEVGEDSPAASSRVSSNMALIDTERQRRYRARTNEEPQARADFLHRKRESFYNSRSESKPRTSVRALTPSAAQRKRDQWRTNKRNQRERDRERLRLAAEMNMLNQIPQSSDGAMPSSSHFQYQTHGTSYNDTLHQLH